MSNIISSILESQPGTKMTKHPQQTNTAVSVEVLPSMIHADSRRGKRKDGEGRREDGWGEGKRRSVGCNLKEICFLAFRD